MAEEASDTEYAEAGWGTDKADYYNADIIETEQDALEEEAEARRLQQKHLAALSEADFGFDDLADVDDGEQGQGTSIGGRQDFATGILPQAQFTETMSSMERLKLLHSLYPEFEHLRRELIDLQPVLEDLQSINRTSKVTEMKRLALSSYLSCLSMYFTLLGSPAGQKDNGQANGFVTILPPQKVRSHPIMGRLVKCRDLWQLVGDLPEPEEEGIDEEATAAVPLEASSTLADVDTSANGTRKRKRKSRAERAAEAAAAEAEAQRQARIQKTQEDLADLSRLIKKPTKQTDASLPAVIVKPSADDSDFGDETALTAEEAAEKARRKKSLRFYTSQIAQKANKRERKGLMAGGDDDIPYRERFRDRQARTMDHPEDRYTSKSALPDSGSDDDDVDNDLTQIKPVQRQREEGVEGDGKRKINYQIEKNKGLTPYRKKEVRNPRVKKRMKFEEKKKKLGSKKAIYKGGEGKGGYGGEKTGINTNVIKSVRLG